MVTTISVFCDVRTTTERPVDDYGSVTEEIDRAMSSDSIHPISL